MISKNVDLLVLEGMGRAIHTNLYTPFNCESLKVTLFSSKNTWPVKTGIEPKNQGNWSKKREISKKNEISRISVNFLES